MNSNVEQFKQELDKWEDIREGHKDISWIPSRGPGVKIVDMDNSYLENVIRNIAGKLAACQFLDWMIGADTYEGIKYETWLSYFKAEFMFRKALEDYRTEKEYSDWQEMEDLINDNSFSRPTYKSSTYTTKSGVIMGRPASNVGWDDIPF